MTTESEAPHAMNGLDLLAVCTLALFILIGGIYVLRKILETAPEERSNLWGERLGQYTLQILGLTFILPTILIIAVATGLKLRQSRPFSDLSSDTYLDRRDLSKPRRLRRCPRRRLSQKPRLRRPLHQRRHRHRRHHPHNSHLRHRRLQPRRRTRRLPASQPRAREVSHFQSTESRVHDIGKPGSATSVSRSHEAS